MTTEVIIDYSLYATYIVFGIALVLTITFPIIQMIGNFKKAIGGLVAIGALVLAFVVCYALTTGEEFVRGDTYASAEVMRIVEASLYLAYIMFAGTVLAIVATSFSRYIK